MTRDGWKGRRDLDTPWDMPRKDRRGELGEMTRDNWKGQKDLGTLWSMPRIEGVDGSGELFHDRYTALLSRRNFMRINPKNTLLNHINAKDRFELRVANIPGFREQVQIVDILEEIMYRHHSNAEACENFICKADVQVKGERRPMMHVTMKFRKADLNTITLTEREMRKVALIHDHPEVRAMFPTVYFVCVFTWDNEYWEGVAMETLNPVKSRIMETKYFYTDALSIVRNMHSQGFIHGDGHSGNFMIRPELPHHASAVAAGGASRADSGAHVSMRLVPIDFDMIRALPEPYRSSAEYNMFETERISSRDASRFPMYLNRLVTKIMIICDYNRLVFTNNPHMPFLNQREKDANMRDIIDSYLQYQCTTNDTDTLNKPSILFMPWPYAFSWEKHYNWDPETIYATLMRKSPNLLQHINELSIADIDMFYLQLLKNSDEDDLKNEKLTELNRTIESNFTRWRVQHPP